MIGVKKDKTTRRYVAVTLNKKPKYVKKVGKIKLTSTELAEKEKAEKPIKQPKPEPVVNISITKKKPKFSLEAAVSGKKKKSKK